MSTTRNAATADDQRTAVELEAAILDGDLSISSELLHAARLRDQHQALLHEAWIRQQQADACAVRDRDVENLRRDILALTDDGEELRRAGEAAVAALETVYTLARDRGVQLDQLAARARSLGITEMGLDDAVRDESGLGWRRDHTTIGPARIRVGDVLLSAASPAKLIARVVRDAFANLGQRVDGFSLSNVGPELAEQVAAQTREITPEPTRRVRVVKRWGPRQPGDVVEVPITDARWAMDKGFGVPVTEAG
jgi:hypothetical protein